MRYYIARAARPMRRRPVLALLPPVKAFMVLRAKWGDSIVGGAETKLASFRLIVLSPSRHRWSSSFSPSLSPRHTCAESSERGQSGNHVGCRSNGLCCRSGAGERRAGKGDDVNDNKAVPCENMRWQCVFETKYIEDSRKCVGSVQYACRKPL